MHFRTLIPAAALAGSLAAPVAAAPAMTAKQFIAKAGASDLWERREAAIMTTSTNADIAGFARQMTTDHTRSTELVKAAAKADRIAAAPPVMTARQQADLAALAASRGAARDSMYVSQQKAAHAEALSLMQGYAASGRSTHLKATAGQIAPVVQGHIDMLDKMTM